MMNQQIFIILSEESSKGGLFDIGATLPLVAVQFLILMFILNIILYNPVFTILNERNEYVLDNLNKTSDLIILSNELSSEYEKVIINVKKDAKDKILKLQKIQRDLFDSELKITQIEIENLTKMVFERRKEKKNAILNTILQEQIKYLASSIIFRISNFSK
jgi:F-type H+-transporting ATPase subunit b